MITGIVRGLAGGVRDGASSGEVPARTAFCSRRPEGPNSKRHEPSSIAGKRALSPLVRERGAKPRHLGISVSAIGEAV